jgi:Tfp pilus assembly protein PilV
MRQHARTCNGYSLLEAMAALMVLNVLCLGLMAWQLQAMQAQRDALSMQQAVDMAQDLWHRMQVHPGAASSYQLTLDSIPSARDCQSQPCNAPNGRNRIWQIGGENCANVCPRPGLS